MTVYFYCRYEMGSSAILKWISCVLAMLIAGAPLSAQSRSDLENKRDKLIREIEYTNGLIARTNKKKKLTVHDLATIESQIQKRNQLIRLLESETRTLQQRTQSLKDSIALLERQLVEVKGQYSLLLRRAYLNKMTQHPYQYFLSANTVAKGFQNMVYLRQINRHIAQKYEALTGIHKTLTQRQNSLREALDNKRILLDNRKKQQDQLLGDQKAKSEALRRLERREKELKVQLSRKKKARIRMNNAIEKIILEELAKRHDDTPETGSASPDIALSNSFASNRGKLPWPVEQGTITSSFGRHRHKTLKQVYTTNNGIDIKTGPGSKIKSIHGGKVVGVANIPGYDKMVVVKQGDYYVVYSRLHTVRVVQGQAVKRGDVIGMLNQSGEQAGLLHIEIWKGKTKLDPKSWLRR